MEEGERGDTHSPECCVMLGAYFTQRLSLSTPLALDHAAK